jgi:hypothetical protein
VGRFIIRWATFAAIANSSTTVVVTGTTYYHYNPWYRKTMYDGEEGYLLTSPPIGYESEELPDGAETVDVEGTTYHYADWGFWQAKSGGGYIVVAPPPGAQVKTIPEESVKHDDEGDVALYQFDQMYFTQESNDAGQAVYEVQPQPPAEELESIPDGSPSFVADAETYYYVDFNFYVAYDEDGKTGFVNGEPDIGAQLDTLPEQAEAIEYENVTYYQWDSVFFEEVEDDAGGTFYEVVDSPGDDEVVDLESE